MTCIVYFYQPWKLRITKQIDKYGYMWLTEMTRTQKGLQRLDIKNGVTHRGSVGFKRVQRAHIGIDH